MNYPSLNELNKEFPNEDDKNKYNHQINRQNPYIDESQRDLINQGNPNIHHNQKNSPSENAFNSYNYPQYQNNFNNNPDIPVQNSFNFPNNNQINNYPVSPITHLPIQNVPQHDENTKQHSKNINNINDNSEIQPINKNNDKKVLNVNINQSKFKEENNKNEVLPMVKNYSSSTANSINMEMISCISGSVVSGLTIVTVNGVSKFYYSCLYLNYLDEKKIPFIGNSTFILSCSNGRVLREYDMLKKEAICVTPPQGTASSCISNWSYIASSSNSSKSVPGIFLSGLSINNNIFTASYCLLNQPVINLQTNPVNHYNGHILTLTNLNVNCGFSYALIDFNLVLTSSTQYAYSYRCHYINNISSNISLSTSVGSLQVGPNYFASGNFLDRHNVNCPSGSAIQQFVLSNVTRSTVQYKYTCVYSNNLYGCSSGSTSESKGGGTENLSRSIYLSTQNFTLPSNYILTSFKLVNRYDKSWYPYYSYAYTYCKI